MANTQTQKDRLRESLVKSLIDMVRSDLAAAWGGDVEVVEGHPDLEWDRRRLATGAMEARDLSAKPFLVVTVVDGSTRPWAISPAGDEVFRSTTLRIDMVAKDHRSIVSLADTVESIFDGAKNGTGAIELKDPDTLSGLGEYAYFNDQVALTQVFSGPGQTSDADVVLPAGKAQFENMKHRASMLVAIDVAKTRGSKVV